jgi:hypothetical protein
MVSQKFSFASSCSRLSVIQLTYQTDADDLGPLLTASSGPPEKLVHKYWFNPVAILAAHYSIWTAVAPRGASGPYTDVVRPHLVIAACFIMPLVVHLYQSIILQQAAKRLFLEPINYRGQPNWPSGFGSRNLRRRIDSVMVGHWPIMLFGPALNSLFWIILAVSEGRDSQKYLKFQLLIALPIIAQWYVALGTSDRSVVKGRGIRWFYICIIILCFVGVLYDAYKDGPNEKVLIRYWELYLAIILGRSTLPFVLSISRLTTTEIRHQWESIRRRWDKNGNRWAEILRRWGTRETRQVRL